MMMKIMVAEKFTICLLLCFAVSLSSFTSDVLAIPILIAANYHQHQQRRLAADNDIIHFNRNNDNNNYFNNVDLPAELSFRANGTKTTRRGVGGGANVSTNYQNGASNYPVNHGVKPINDEIKSIKRNRSHHQHSDSTVNWIRHDNVIYRLVIDHAKRVVTVKPIGRDAVDAEPAPSSYRVHEFPYPPPAVASPWPTLHHHPDLVVHELHRYYETTKKRNFIKLGIRSYHQPPNPVLQVLLSHYGKYLPTPQIWGVQGNGWYGYSAGNDLHNNAPNGAYKIVPDYDK